MAPDRWITRTMALGKPNARSFKICGRFPCGIVRVGMCHYFDRRIEDRPGRTAVRGRRTDTKYGSKVTGPSERSAHSRCRYFDGFDFDRQYLESQKILRVNKKKSPKTLKFLRLSPISKI